MSERPGSLPGEMPDHSARLLRNGRGAGELPVSKAPHKERSTMKVLTLTAALLAAALTSAVAQQQGQNGRFCFTSEDGGRNCGFATLEQCNAARKGVTRDICVPNEMSGRGDRRLMAPTR